MEFNLLQLVENSSVSNDDEEMPKHELIFIPNYDRIFPLKRQMQPNECRDAFLKEIFAELELTDDDADDGASYAGSRRSSTMSRYSAFSTFPRDSATSALSVYSMPSTQSENISRRSIDWLPPVKRMTQTAYSSQFMRNLHKRVAYSRRLSRFSTITLKPKHMPHLDWSYENVAFDDLYDMVKRSAIYYNFSRMIDRLRVILSYTSVQNDKLEENTPYHLFSWALEEFFIRRELEDAVYLDVLLFENTVEYLNLVKYRTDIRELIRFCKFLYNEYYRSKPNWHRKVYAILWEAKQFVYIHESLQRELQLHRMNLTLIARKVENMTYQILVEHNARSLKTKREHEIHTDALDPIEWRYQRDWYRTKAEMFNMKQELQITALEQQVKYYKELIDKATFCNTVTLNTYYMQTENYNERLYTISTKYANDLEATENDITFAGFRLKSIQEKYNKLQETYAMFKQRIAEVKEQLEQERLEQIAIEQREAFEAAEALRIQEEKKIEAKLSKANKLRNKA